MPANTGAIGDDARKTVDDGHDLVRDATRLGSHLKQAAPDLARQARGVLSDRFDQFREQGRDAASIAGDQLEEARTYVVERVQDRPLTATIAALGVGFLLGLMISGSRR